jgi:hypothetical protein
MTEAKHANVLAHALRAVLKHPTGQSGLLYVPEPTRALAEAALAAYAMDSHTECKNPQKA